MGFNLRDQYSGYLKKEDFPSPALLTITSLEVIDLGGEEKVVMSFHEVNKPMILNKSNGETLCQLFGNDTDGIVGNTIVVYADPNIMFGGKRVGGLRLRAPKKPPASKTEKVDTDAALHAARTAAESADDDCPF